MREISVNNLKNNIEIIDIRDKYLYNMGHIPYAKNIPKNLLLMNPDNYLDKYKTYYIYCSYGINSKKTCEILSNKGYDVINIIGGYNEYNLCKHILRND